MERLLVAMMMSDVWFVRKGSMSLVAKKGGNVQLVGETGEAVGVVAVGVV